MIHYLAENMWLLWLCLTMMLLIFELSSGDFYLTCFALGAALGMFTSLLQAPVWLQVLVFALSAIASIWFLRPVLLKVLHPKGHGRLSNADALIGRVGEVSQAIPPHGYGRVKIDGDDWKSLSSDNALLSVGERVRVIGRDSVILTVERVD